MYTLQKNIRYEGWWLNDFDDREKKMTHSFFTTIHYKKY